MKMWDAAKWQYFVQLARSRVSIWKGIGKPNMRKIRQYLFIFGDPFLGWI
jgi:hypothetical protein